MYLPELGASAAIRYILSKELLEADEDEECALPGLLLLLFLPGDLLLLGFVVDATEGTHGWALG